MGRPSPTGNDIQKYPKIIYIKMNKHTIYDNEVR